MRGVKGGGEEGVKGVRLLLAPTDCSPAPPGFNPILASQKTEKIGGKHRGGGGVVETQRSHRRFREISRVFTSQ